MTIKIKTVLLFCLLVFSTGWCGAQNLVPNPSFEDRIACPVSTGTNLIELATGWHSMRNSPNYFNSCVNESFQLWDDPLNGFGFQDAASGNAYAGLTEIVLLLCYIKNKM